jgi:hypothetical protein
MGDVLDSAKVPGYSGPVTFSYAFDCGDGGGYGAFGSGSSASCPTSSAGSRAVKGKVRHQENGATEYTGTVTVAEPTVGVFSHACIYSTNRKGEKVVAVSWEGASPGVTLIEIVGGSTLRK